MFTTIGARTQRDKSLQSRPPEPFNDSKNCTLSDRISLKKKRFSSTLTLLSVFERDLIRERTNAGLEAARARGKKGGRKRVLTDKQISIGKSLAADPTRSISDICETLKISPATYYHYIHQEKK